jgi:membrane protein YqaA with SNARE-associated domain
VRVFGVADPLHVSLLAGSVPLAHSPFDLGVEPLISVGTGHLAVPTPDALLFAVADSWSPLTAAPSHETGWLGGLVRSATGWFGLAVIFAYSFLIAFALPGVSEVVLLAPIDLGLPYWARMSTIILISGVGKAAGSLLAFHIGQEAKEAGPIIRALRRSRFDVVEWSEKRTVQLARRWGYAGLALALCVPGFPDTLSIYAFAVLERDYFKFALATFLGSVGRLVLWMAGAEVVLFLI